MKPISDWEGRLIGGRYELKIRFDATRMSSVFKAWDHQNECWVVVKMVHRTDVSLVTRLKREKAALERLNHPRIVRLFDSGTDGDFFFLVLEYLPGVDLRVGIQSRSLSLTQEMGISFGLQILEGLEAMHAAGMVHRDLKPGNLMLTPDGVTIIDLGLLKLTNPPGPRRRRLTQRVNAVVGTLDYVSPEQKRGGSVDKRSDLYACGIILYELLTGERPFYKSGDAEWRKWQAAHAKDWMYYHGPLRPFPETSRIPEKVQAVVWKALAVDPADRFQTAQEMRLALLAARPFSVRRFLEEIPGKIGGKIRSALRKAIRS